MDNNMGYYGGCVYVDNADLTISNSNFGNNSARFKAGVIYARGSNVTITGSSFVSNIVKWSTGGGAIYTHDSKVRIADTSFTQNSALLGGAIAMRGNTGFLALSNSCEFNNNTARNYGDDIYCDAHAQDDVTISISRNTQIPTSNIYNNKCKIIQNI